MRTRFPFAFVLILVAASMSAQAVPPLAGQEILDKNLEAIGGRDAWNRVNTMVIEGTVTGPSPNYRAFHKALYQRPDKVWVLDSVGGVGDTFHACNGKDWWWIADGKFHSDRSGRHPCEVPLPGKPWSEVYKNIEFKGTKDVDGRPAYLVRLTTRRGDHVLHYYDEATFMLLRSILYADGGTEVITIEQNFSDYREVAGVKVFFAMTETAMGNNGHHGMSSMAITRLDINVPITTRTFEMPAAADRK